jgi:hypothetical protein
MQNPNAISPVQGAYTLGTPGQAQTPQQPSGGGGVLGLIPTGLSVLGGALGAELGPAGIIGGSGLGSALGQGIEDAVTKQNPSNIIGAGIAGAGGGALGLGTGAILGKLGEMAGSKLASGAAKDMFAKDLQDQAAEAATRFNEFGQAMPTADEQTRAGLGSAIDLAQRMGVNTTVPGFAQDMSDLSGAVTRQNGGLNVFKQNILNNAGPINMGNSGTLVRNTIENNLGVISSKRPLEPANVVYNALKPGLHAPENMQADPTTAQNWLSFIGGKMHEADIAAAKDPANTTAKAIADTYHSIYDQTHNLIWGRPEVQTALDNIHAQGKVSPKTFLENPTYNKGLEGLPEDVRQNVAQHMADTINNAQTMKDITQAESQFVKMGKLADDAVKTNREAVGTSAAKARAQEAAKGAQQEATAHGQTMGEHVRTAAAVAGGPHTAIPHFLGMMKGKGVPATMAVLQKLGQASGTKAGKLASQAAAQLLVHGGDFQNPNNSALTAATGGAGMQQPGGATLANGSPMTSQDLVAQLDAMMSADPLQAAALTPLLGQLMQKTQAINAANAALGQYQTTLGQASLGGGPIGGLLASLGGLVGGPAGQLGPEAQAAQQAMAAAGAPGVQLPGVYANPAAQQASLGQAQSILSSLGAQ